MNKGSLQNRPRNLLPTLLFEDTHCIVLSKPAGLLCQGERSGDDNLVDWLRLYLRRPYVGLVHRLDRNTSGVMVVAKRTKAANRLSEALGAGKICRTYLAFLHGHLEAATTWIHFLAKDEARNVVRVVREIEERRVVAMEHENRLVHSKNIHESRTQGKTFPATKEYNLRNFRNAKRAELSVRPIQSGFWRGTPLTLAEFRLETGRSHQIRVQAAASGFPLLGDVKYGPKNSHANRSDTIRGCTNKSCTKRGFAKRGFAKRGFASLSAFKQQISAENTSLDGLLQLPFNRPALHSHRIEFPHPMSGEILCFEAPLPSDMQQVLVELRPP